MKKKLIVVLAVIAVLNYFESQEGLPSGIIQYSDGTEEMHTAFPVDEYVYYYVMYPDGTDAGGSYDVIFSDIIPEDYVEFKAEKIEKVSGCVDNYFGEVFYLMPEAKYIDTYQHQMLSL